MVVREFTVAARQKELARNITQANRRETRKQIQNPQAFCDLLLIVVRITTTPWVGIGV